MSLPDATLRNRFLRDYVAALESGDAAFFAGAGLSRDSGYVDWKGLLREFAEELGLDIDIEYDLPMVAQYFIDESNQQRGRLNQRLREQFDKAAPVTAVYSALTRLPIKSIWTTNYDQGIERAYENQHLVADVKSCGRQSTWVTSKPDASVAIYKMHGDIGDPDNLVLSRDDYDRYAYKYSYILDSLKAQLSQQTFLFSGFSFTDPNLDHVLAQVRSNYGDNSRTHWVLMKRHQDGMDAKRQELWVRTMKRYGLETILLDDYDEIGALLVEADQRLRRRHVFVSGSATTPDPFGQDRLDDFGRKVGQRIIRSGRNLVSGFGLGVGASVLSGAAEEVYRVQSDPAQRLRLFPFPQPSPGQPRDKQMDEKWRQGMLRTAGFAVFISGNRRSSDDSPELAAGVLREFEIAIANGAYPLPVGATGWMASELHRTVGSRFEELLPGAPRESFNLLADTGAENDALLGALDTLIESLSP
ncbi:SIR2 family protein [Rhodococcus sp. IEGM 1330]|uniref:SIR2 family protein n=1 Tax=Rhodococcus sp. IEGM 1330 TaxID=3082225 RepID=UPI002954B2DB|nr:SIR2 family protein [Rhodococcus sp. IEGM 1330]MDV8021585.1 SIR2 family protein [Rhodococcus sp. IEGM 1330]